MRDVSFKVTTLRRATAQAEVVVSPATIGVIERGEVPKGDPFAVAKVAAVMAAKKTTEWIPYCHNIPIEHVTVDFRIDAPRLIVTASVTSVAKTGVEMEAMTAAMAGALNLYDMLKMIDDDMEIVAVRLLEKTGGKSDFGSLNGWSGGVLTVSDRASRGEYEDRSGAVLAGGMKQHGAAEVEQAVIPDDAASIEAHVKTWVASGIQLILVTGGTGVGARDVTPEAISPLIEKSLPGVVQAFIQYGQDRKRTAMFTRCVAGVIGESIVVALPGSPSACEDAVQVLFPHILHLIPMLKGGGHE